MNFPILTPADLPEPETSIELPNLDFKRADESSKDHHMIEKAKDVAAMANALGGTILIGTQVADAKLTAFPGVPHDSVNGLLDAYEKAVEQRCRPSPRISAAVIPQDAAKTIVAINVWPCPVAPVGVRVGPMDKAPYVENAWLFPVRVGSQTRYLQPDQFGTLGDMNARQIAAWLSAIPNEERNRVALRWQTKSSSGYFGDHVLNGQLEDVKLEKNVAVFAALVGGEGLMVGGTTVNGGAMAAVPLTWIDTVYRDDAQNCWNVQLRCVLHPDNPGRIARYEATLHG